MKETHVTCCSVHWSFIHEEHLQMWAAVCCCSRETMLMFLFKHSDSFRSELLCGDEMDQNQNQCSFDVISIKKQRFTVLLWESVLTVMTWCCRAAVIMFTQIHLIIVSIIQHVTLNASFWTGSSSWCCSDWTPAQVRLTQSWSTSCLCLCVTLQQDVLNKDTSEQQARPGDRTVSVVLVLFVLMSSGLLSPETQSVRKHFSFSCQNKLGQFELMFPLLRSAPELVWPHDAFRCRLKPGVHHVYLWHWGSAVALRL